MARRDNAPQTNITSNVLRGNREEWEHQVKLLERRIKRFERDYNVEVDYKKPEAPKDRNWKRAIERIKNVRRPQLEKRAYQKDERGQIKVNEQGEAEKFVRPKRGQAKSAKEKAREDRETAEQPSIYDIVIENLRNYISSFDMNRNKSVQEYSRNKLLSLLDSAIQRVGAEVIAERAEKMADLEALAQAALWQSKQEKADVHIRGFARVVYDRGSSREDKVFMESIYEEAGLYA